MPVFFDLLKAEENPAARIVLGHFIFVFIHPFPDGKSYARKLVTGFEGRHIMAVNERRQFSTERDMPHE